MPTIDLNDYDIQQLVDGLTLLINHNKSFISEATLQDRPFYIGKVGDAIALRTRLEEMLPEEDN
jgi:hypothetical protein